MSNTFDFAKLSTATATESDFALAASNIHGRVSSVQGDIQIYLVGAAQAAIHANDMTRAVPYINNLIDNMPKGVRIDAIQKWVIAFMGFVVVAEGDNAGKFTSGKMQVKHLNIEEMSKRENAWFNFIPAPMVKAFSLQALIAIAVEKGEKATKKGLKDDDDCDAATLAVLKSLLPVETETETPTA